MALKGKSNKEFGKRKFKQDAEEEPEETEQEEAEEEADEEEDERPPVKKKSAGKKAYSGGKSKRGFKKKGKKDDDEFIHITGLFESKSGKSHTVFLKEDILEKLAALGEDDLLGVSESEYGLSLWAKKAE